METTSTEYKHVDIDANGTARVAGTAFKVRLLVQEWNAWDRSPAQMYSVLAYYLDHKEEIDAEIEERRRRSEEIRKKTEDPELQERLRRAKRRRQSEQSEA